MAKNISGTVTRTTSAAGATPTTARQPGTDGGAAAVTLLRYQAVVGLDVGDRQSHYCVLDRSGDVATEGVVST
jgi:hypothetical protein